MKLGEGRGALTNIINIRLCKWNLSLYIREAAPNVVKITNFFADNFISMALIYVKFQSNKLKLLFF